MKSFFGRILFWLSLPLLTIYMPFKPRARVLVTSGNYVLAARSWYGSGKWSTPGGGLYRHESYKNAAIRELYEETGILIIDRDLKELYLSSERFGVVVKTRYAMFNLELPNRVPTMTKSHEQVESKWVSMSTVLNNRRHYTQDIINGLTFLKDSRKKD